MSMPMPLECRNSREYWRKAIKSDCDAPDVCERFFCTHQRALLLEAFNVLDAMQTRAEQAERERDVLAKVAAKVQCWNCPLKRQCKEFPVTGCSGVILEWARQQAWRETKNA